MFSQFRSRYPTGSLIAELVTIYQGKYVVRVLVQVEGATLATGLAAADTPEQAEDRARNRALDVLGIAPSTSPSEMSYGASLQTAATEVPPSAAFQTSFPREKGLSSQTLGQPIPSTLQRESVGNVERAATTAPISTVSNDWLSSDDDSMGWKDESNLKGGDERSSPITSGLNVSEDFDFGAPLPFEESTATAPGSDATDLSDALLKIDDLINRIGWSAEQERDYLKRTYGKGKIGRSFLDASEVLEFLDYLEVLAKTSEEIGRLRWTARQESDYLERHYKKTERSQLTYPELLDFLQYLDVFAKTSEEIKRLRWSSDQGKNYLQQTYGKEWRTQLSSEQLQEFLHYLQSL